MGQCLCMSDHSRYVNRISDGQSPTISVGDGMACHGLTIHTPTLVTDPPGGRKDVPASCDAVEVWNWSVEAHVPLNNILHGDRPEGQELAQSAQGSTNSGDAQPVAGTATAGSDGGPRGGGRAVAVESPAG